MDVLKPSVTKNRSIAPFTVQGIILSLALAAGYSGTVISFRQLSRSSISPCEQVGEHYGGAVVNGITDDSEAARW